MVVYPGPLCLQTPLPERGNLEPIDAFKPSLGICDALGPAPLETTLVQKRLVIRATFMIELFAC